MANNNSADLLRRNFLRQSAAMAVPILATPLLCAPFVGRASAQEMAVERVTFKDPVGTTSIVGYLAQKAKTGDVAAVVMLPSQSGPYGKGAGRADAGALTPRYRAWMQHWHDQGYAALIVDSFSARGYVGGYAESAPKGLDPMSDRPRDAYGALAFLRGRRNILMERVFLMGWGHGGTATLAAFNRNMAEEMAVFLGITLSFRAVAALYPGCNSILNLSGLGKYKPGGKILLATVGKDDAADPQSCRLFANRLPNKYLGGNLFFAEATNKFDSGGAPAGPDDARAAKEVLKGVTDFFAKV